MAVQSCHRCHLLTIYQINTYVPQLLSYIKDQIESKLKRLPLNLHSTTFNHLRYLNDTLSASLSFVHHCHISNAMWLQYLRQGTNWTIKEKNYVLLVNTWKSIKVKLFRCYGIYAVSFPTDHCLEDGFWTALPSCSSTFEVRLDTGEEFCNHQGQDLFSLGE